jgi:hypothetical protein
MMSQTFSESSVVMCSDQVSKARMVGYWTDLYRTYGSDIYKANLDIWSAIPVNDQQTPESFMTRMLPFMGQSPAYRRLSKLCRHR